MALPIRETPTLYGEDARKFLRDVEENLKLDHTEDFKKSMKAYESLKKNTTIDF